MTGQIISGRRRRLRLIFKITGGTILVCALFLYLSSVFILHSMANHRVEKQKNTPKGLGLTAETIDLISTDGIPLQAWYVSAAAPEGFVILLHGMDGMDASSFLPQAVYLHDAGYSCLILDMRAHGRSGGDHIGFAFEEPRDVDAALDWAAFQPELQGIPVVLMGFSMGGATAIRTAAARPDVDAVISVSAFSSMDRMLG